MTKMLRKFSRILWALSILLVGSPATVDAQTTEAEVYVAGHPDHYPIEYFDPKDQTFKGIVPDLFHILSEKTGIQFTYMDGSVDRDNLIKNLQVDMISAYSYNREQIEAYNLTLSEKYFSIPSEQGAEDIYLAFTPIADPEMITRITDALQSVTSEQKEQILWSKIPKELANTHTRTNIILKSLLFVAAALFSVTIFFVRKYKKRLMKQIHTDRMTGYGNHVQLFEDYALLVTDNNRCSYSVVNLKIENFSSISEEHGFVVRDHTLAQISEVIQSNLSEQERFARISEGSFILVIQYLSRQQLSQRLDQLYADIENVIKQRSKDYAVSLKSGIYGLTIQDQDLNPAINNAIQARRYAQNQNLNYAIYDESVFKSIKLVKELDQEIISSIENDEFIPYFQPKLDLKRLEIVGFEALSRWQNRKRGLLFPGQFIPILEKNGLLGEVDIALFRNVCQLLGQRVKDGKELLHISCNFSRYSFYQPDFCTTLKEIAHEQQVPTSYLEIEISNPVSAENMSEIIGKINELKSYGFTVALDNFGGGYSTITDLQNCSIDTLKLDKEIIRDMQNPKTESIVGSIIEMCHGIGVEVACQGVETEEQLQLLKQVNCDYGQGYIFYQPMPYSELDKLVQRI